MRLYCSDRSANSAIVQFEVPEGTAVSGSIRGPFCRFSRTLPCTIPIRDGKAVVVDPCYWTPRLPFRYQVTVTITDQDDTRTDEFLWGLRWCVPHRSNLLLDGKGFVIRAASAHADPDLQEYRELSCALLTHRRLTSEVYQEASDLGVMVIDTDLTEYEGDQSTESISRYPAVHFLAKAADQSDTLSIAPVSLSQRPNADVTLLQAEQLDDIKWDWFAQRAILVERCVESARLSDLRGACDRLQRDLATSGQFAGYLISTRP